MSWGEPVSDRQADLIRKLYSEIDPEFGAARAARYLAGTPTRRDASAHIDTLIDQAKKAKAARAAAPEPETVASAAAVPAPARVERPPLMFPEPGYYCVEFEHALRFYRVKEGKGFYADRRFLDRFKSDELRSIRYPEKIAVLDAINADPTTAAMRFAVELTRCYSCGRMLTDEISRLRGQGPDCFGLHPAKDDIGMRALGSV